MPLAGYAIAHIMGLSDIVTAGIVLLGSCPGGTASNLISFLAKADVALSITLTSISTFVAIFATPCLTWLLVGHAVHVPVFKMFLTMLKLVVVPVGTGIILNSIFPHRIKKIHSLCPLLSIVAIVTIIAVIIAINKPVIGNMGFVIIAAVIMHNLTGLFAGYFICRSLGYDIVTARTIAIETGMQNSGLSVALAIKFFSHAAALPGALFSIWHNISGAFVATLWGTGNNETGQRDDRK
jgi:BASS family bile acid:Na+ symporter